MDEQTTLQQEQINSPEPQQDFSQDIQPETENFDDYQDDYQEDFSQPEEDINSDVGFDDNGDVNFSDDYLAEQEKHFFSERTEPPAPDEPEPVKFYTDEELLNTPFEQWQADRLNGDIKKFVPIVQQQMQRRQLQNQVAQKAQQVPEFLQYQPQQYTPKELSDEAQKLACERLGLDDPDDFDEYEGEHRAALNLAMQELAGNRQREIAEYSRRSADWQQLQNFNRSLAAQPDFQEFNHWYVGRLREMNVTPEKVNAYLYQKAVNNGYNFGGIAQEVAGWYREFQETKARRPRANMPPVLESTRGGYSDTRGSVNLRNFGDMDNDAQARALMRMGVV